MEYEIEDDGALFDASTNPSLDHSRRRAAENRSSARPGVWRKPQKAERIPEEVEPA